MNARYAEIFLAFISLSYWAIAILLTIPGYSYAILESAIGFHFLVFTLFSIFLLPLPLAVGLFILARHLKNEKKTRYYLVLSLGGITLAHLLYIWLVTALH